MVKLEGFDFPDDMYFHADHMWAKVEGDKVRVGYNAWAADAAGKLVSIKTRPAGKPVKAGKTLGSVESGKWVGSLKVPGKVLAAGSLSKPVKIAAFSFSEGAVEKIKLVKGEYISLDELLASGVEPSQIRIMK